jgi:FtsZ-interacting cell division protein ZipA
VITADQLARKLGGVICDERSHRMTNQSLMHLRGEVLDLERRRRLWG